MISAITPERWQEIKHLVNSALQADSNSRTALLQQSCADDLAMRLGAEALLSATRPLPAALLAPDQWQRIEQLFQAALEVTPSQRPAFLAQACGSDEALRHEVESLLVYQGAAGGLIQGAVHEAAGLLPNDEKARFTPGTTLNKRYRILGLLGKGGMGEVYRADDLKLGQPVALKFLTEKLSRDKAMLARFHSEVAMAHRVTHPNVCRVHDIGEVTTSSGNLHFLSMEYVDGEDLSSLLRRIGRLPSDKAVEIANQLCAGLAAAHEAGVLHRDLKPANVMIDGKGKVRITDFGLAGFAEQFKGSEVFAGTPAYMSPEQFAGKEVTTKSDIYALGLVLYEIFTGKRVFEAGSLEELKRMHESSAPPTPSSWVKDLDPLVERVILRCLEKDPARRLASAKQVADALPGGDPLAAALALGETPSPEMVAAAGSKTGMKPTHAVACLLTVIACLIALPFLYRHTNLFERVRMENSPEVLARKAREINTQLGWPEQPVDTAYGLTNNFVEFEHRAKTAKTMGDWDKLATEERMPYLFWYRESPIYLFAQQYTNSFPRITGADPARSTTAGMTYLTLNLWGKLYFFEAIPNSSDRPIDAPGAKISEPDWKIPFAAAGLDFSQFKPAEQVRGPQTAYDIRAAWVGPHPRQPAVQLHIEAAAYRGRLVYFYTTETNRVEMLREQQQQRFQPSTASKISSFGFTTMMLVLLLSAAWITRRNLQLNRGDRTGAIRLAAFVFVCSVAENLLTAHHTPTTLEYTLFLQILARSLLHAGFSWLFYLALEPYVRRRWPNTLIGWQRLSAGGWRDPLVGRDILLGLVSGLGVQTIAIVLVVISIKMGGKPNLQADFGAMLNLPSAAGLLIGNLFSATYFAAWVFFLVFMTCVLVRRDWLAGGLLILLYVALVTPMSPLPLFAAIPIFTVFGIGIFVAARRYGLLVLSVVGFSGMVADIPLTTNLSAWYAGNALFVAVVLLALAIYAFRTSLGGQKVFSGKLLEE
ncbi:MAG: serine/threonine protein kinase [Blastocatellia bacterium]|nr:serine/threonine protein kinase [Blastocatellia bacterium]